MTDAPLIPEDDDAAMGEYVLGLLPADEAAVMDRRIAEDPALARLHSEWADMMTGLLAGREVAPPAKLRAALISRLFPQARPRRRWLGWTGLVAGPLAAFALAVVLLRPPGFDPSLHVDLTAPEAGLTIAVGADEDTLRLINLSGEPAAGRAFQMWLIDGDAAPVSLGLLPESGQVDLPRPPGLAEGVIIAVSDEPAGGSTTGAPTGPVLAAAPLFPI